MKCALLTDTSFPEASSRLRILSTIASLKGLSIDYDRFNVNFAPSAATLSTDYDFILIPDTRSVDYRSLINDVTLTIPVFALNVRSVGTAQVSATPGISGSAGAQSDYFMDTPFTTSKFVAMYSAPWTLASPGIAIITVSATSPIDGAAQTFAGRVVAWRTTKGSGNMYCSSINIDTQPMLAFLLQAAFDNGDFTAAQIRDLRKLPVTLDIDHVNGTDFANDLTVMKRWLDLIPNGVSWCGAVERSTGGLESMAADVVAKLVAEDGKRLKYSFHTHATGKSSVSGTWPSQTEAITKTAQDTNWASLKALWEAQGLTYSQAPGYYVPANNMWNEATLELMSAHTSLASSVDNLTSKAGYGITMVRYATSNSCSRPAPDLSVYPRNIHCQREYMRGMTLVPSKDIGTGDSAVTATAWRGKWQQITRGIHYGLALYVHDEDFKDTQAPASAEYGVELYSQFGEMATYLKDVTKFWADPTEYSISARFV
ncbi:MAG: hypothetical protein BMS9Abin02_2140 [Anaerolineae bacterium]|nr:MAG: hypothetical protein BMS9Abin02_2140 [Anaerolineae bacterium]